MASGSSPALGPRASIGTGLALATAIVGLGFLGSRLLGILRTVAIANAFGSSPELGAYNVAFKVPDLIFQVLAGATLGSAFIPVFARMYRQEGEERAWRLASAMLNIVTAGTAALCLLAFILAPLLVPWFAPDLGKDVGRHDELTGQAVTLTRLMLLSPLLFSVSGMITGILNARQQFLLSALAPMLYNLAIIFGALVLSGPFGVEGLAAGVVVGSALHLVVQVPGLFRQKMRYQFMFNLRDSATREVGRLMGPRVIGLGATQINFFITTYFASKISTAAISDMAYAWLLAGLPLALFGMALSTAVFPRLADHAAGGEFAQLHATVSKSLRIIMFLTIPAAVGLAVLREPITTLLLERGEFTGADTRLTAAALAWYCLGIVPWAGIEIHSRAFYAMGDTRTPVIFAVGAVGLNLAFSAMLYRSFETQGLAAAVSLAAWIEWALLYSWYSIYTRAHTAEDLRTFATFAMCAAVMAFTLVVTLAFFDTTGRLHNAIIAVAGAVAGGALFAGLASGLNIPEFEDAVDRIRGRIGR